MENPKPKGDLWQQIRKPVISLFLVVYLYTVTLWLLCPSPRRDALLKPLEPIIYYTGLWQAFTIFSPDPRKINVYLDAVVTFDDGSVYFWQYPRMDKLGVLEKFYKERYRKYGIDHLNWENESILWPDLARYAARLSLSAGKHPVKVQLERHWSLIPVPLFGLGHDTTRVLYANKNVFFSYNVKPEDLK